MATSIGPKIQIEGEAAFKKAITDINTSLKTMGTEMKAVSSAYDKGDTSSAKLTAQNQVLNKQIGTQKDKLSELTAMLDKSKEAYGENDSKTQKLQQSVNLATADLNKMERQLGENESSLESAGKAADDSGNRFEKLSGTLKASAVAIGAVAVAAGAVAVSLGKAVISAFADYEQLVGGVDTLFKESSGKLQEYAADAYKTAGLSANEYMDTVTSFSASLIGSLGGDTEKAVQYADMAITDMSDNANKMGTDMGSIQNAYSGFAKGTYTMLDNLKLGYAGTKGEMERLLVDATAISGIKYDISSYSDVVQAIHVMQESMGIAGTTALEAEETISGSLNMMGSAWSNLIVGFGNADADMGKLVGAVVGAFNTVVKNIVPVIENIAAALPMAFKEMLPAIGSVLPTLLKTVVDLFKQVLDTLLKLFPTLIPVVVEALLTIVDAIIDNLSLIIDAAFILLVSLADGIIKALPEMVPRIVQVVVKIVETIIQNLPMIIAVALQVIIALAGGLIKAIPQLITAVPKLVSAIVSAFKSYMKEMTSIGTNIVKGIWTGISDKATWLLGKIKSWCGSILKGIKAFFGIKSPSRVMGEVGENIGIGLAIGVESTQRRVAKAAQSIGKVLMDEEESIQKQLAKMDSDAIIKREAESEANHKDALAKKYTELAKADKKGKQKVLDEISKLQKDREATLADASEKNLKESLNNQLKIVQNFRKEYEKAVEDIGKSQDNMANKLMSFGELFERTQNQLGRDIFKLTDLEKEINAIENYGDALSSLKDRGVSQSLLSEITGMNIEDATDYTRALLQKTEEEYDKYMSLWERKQEASKSVATTFYKDELDALKLEFVDKIPDELAGIKDSMLNIGVKAGQGLADGFASQKEYIKNAFSSIINDAIGGANNQMRGIVPTSANKNGGGVDGRVASIMQTVAPANDKPVNITVTLDGKVLARQLYDPLQSESNVRGKTLAYGI